MHTNHQTSNTQQHLCDTSMTSSKQLSKIEQSPHFQQIVELYRAHKNNLSKKEIFKAHIEPLDPSLRYHQFIRLTVKLDEQVTVETSKVMAHYVDGEVNTARIRQELYMKALQLGDQSLTSTLELWEKSPERITSKQLRDFFKMYSEMEKVRQADQVIDLKRKEQEYEQKFKPAGMFADIWVKMFRWSTTQYLTQEDIKLLDTAVTPFFDMLHERYIKRQQGADFQNRTQVVEGIPAAN